MSRSQSSQGDKKIVQSNKSAFWIFLSTLIAGAIFAFYLWQLYQQLDYSFKNLTQFAPTKIYSDVTKVSPPQRRQEIEDKLRALAYSYETSSAEEIDFVLHPIDFPLDLIADHQFYYFSNDPSKKSHRDPIDPSLELRRVQELSGRKVKLRFQGEGLNGVLHSILVDEKEIPEFFLEPELITSLSRPNKLNPDKKIRTNIEFDSTPSMIWKAIIAVEDQHFLEHRGFDPRGIARAIWVNLRTLSFAQGGSTITQQLVKNLMVRRTKNIFRKVNELFLALLLEATRKKEEILERYLNEVYLGQVGSLEVHGVVEGARYFFGKELKELNLGEISMMAGLIRGPGYYSPYRNWDRARERQRIVLKKMVDTRQITQEESKLALAMDIHLAPPQVVNRAPYFSDFVKAELVRFLRDKREMGEDEVVSAGFKVYTTLDTTANLMGQKAVSEGIKDLEKNLKLKPDEVLEGALVSVEQSTGFIRTLIGGKNYARSNFNRILNMKRQVGSTFKPIVYLAALKKRISSKGIPYGGGYPLEDGPWKLTYDRGKRTWSPRNYDRESQGWVSMRGALANSINTATARLGFEIGLDEVIETGRALGILSDLPKVPALVLGISELSPVELLRVYAVFANHGVQDDLTVIRKIMDSDGNLVAGFQYRPRQVFEAGPIDLLTEMLQSVFTEGTAKHAHRLGLEIPAAGKTGTTSHSRDAWFAGYTPARTTVVWVGLDQFKRSEKEKGLQLTGASSALPVWIRFMNEVTRGEAVANFPSSPYLVDVPIDLHTGKKAKTDCSINQVSVEKYLRGIEPTDETCEAHYPESVSEGES